MEQHIKAVAKWLAGGGSSWGTPVDSIRALTVAVASLGATEAELAKFRGAAAVDAQRIETLTAERDAARAELKTVAERQCGEAARRIDHEFFSALVADPKPQVEAGGSALRKLYDLPAEPSDTCKTCGALATCSGADGHYCAKHCGNPGCAEVTP